MLKMIVFLLSCKFTYLCRPISAYTLEQEELDFLTQNLLIELWFIHSFEVRVAILLSNRQPTVVLSSR